VTVELRLNFIRAESARIRDVIARTHQIVVASKELLSRPAPDTFIGRRTHEPLLRDMTLEAEPEKANRRTLTQVSATFGTRSYCRHFCDQEETLSELRSVLIVEDEYFLQADLEKALTDAGFATESVSSGEEALTLFIGGTGTYRASVIDVRLRGNVSGWEVARRIREREPAFPIVYVTGSSAEEWASEGVPNSILISKPFAVARLVSAVANLLNIRMPPTA